MAHEPINGVDYKACQGCGEDHLMRAFIVGLDEVAYCPECRRRCSVCGDWLGTEDHNGTAHTACVQEEATVWTAQSVTA